MTCAGTISHNEQKWVIFLSSQSPLKYLQNDVWFVGIGWKMTTSVWSPKAKSPSNIASFPPVLFSIIITILA